MSEMIEQVKAAMTRYIEGSYSGSSGTHWRIYDSWHPGLCVANLLDREERDAQLKTMNARAVIETMREPTEAMISAAAQLNHPRDEEIWRAMIDAETAQPPDPRHDG